MDNISQIISGELNRAFVTAPGEGPRKLVPGFSPTLYHEPSAFVDLALYLFTVISLSHEYDYLLSPVSSPNKS